MILVRMGRGQCIPAFVEDAKENECLPERCVFRCHPENCVSDKGSASGGSQKKKHDSEN